MQCYINKNPAVFQMECAFSSAVHDSSTIRLDLSAVNMYQELPVVCVILWAVIGLRICISSLCSENYH